MQVGPISAMIDTATYSFFLYTGGVYNDDDCRGILFDSGTLVVGYGTTDDKKDFWIIKMSWGEKWGESGYMRLARNVNRCGIAALASYPIL